MRCIPIQVFPSVSKSNPESQIQLYEPISFTQVEFNPQPPGKPPIKVPHSSISSKLAKKKNPI